MGNIRQYLSFILIFLLTETQAQNLSTCTKSVCHFVDAANQLLTQQLSDSEIRILKDKADVFLSEAENYPYIKKLQAINTMADLKLKLKDCGSRDGAVMEGVVQNCSFNSFQPLGPLFRQDNFLQTSERIIDQVILGDAKSVAQKVGKEALGKTYDSLIKFLCETGRSEDLKYYLSDDYLRWYTPHLDLNSNLAKKKYSACTPSLSNATMFKVKNESKKKEYLMAMNDIIAQVNSYLSTVSTQVSWRGFGVPRADYGRDLEQVFNDRRAWAFDQAKNVGPVGLGGRVYQVLSSYPALQRNVGVGVWDLKGQPLKDGVSIAFVKRLNDQKMLNLSDIENSMDDAKNLLHREMDNSRDVARDGNINRAIEMNPSLFGSLAVKGGLTPNSAEVLCEALKSYQGKLDGDERFKIIRNILGGACALTATVLCFTPLVEVAAPVGVGCGVGMMTSTGASLFLKSEQRENLKATLAAGTNWSGAQGEIDSLNKEFDELWFTLALDGATTIGPGALAKLLKEAKNLADINRILKAALSPQAKIELDSVKFFESKAKDFVALGKKLGPEATQSLEKFPRYREKLLNDLKKKYPNQDDYEKAYVEFKDQVSELYALQKKSDRPLWGDEGRDGGYLDNLIVHYNKHKKEFPQYKGIGDYAKAAQDFGKNPPIGTRFAVQESGEVIYYNVEKNIFLSVNPNGLPTSFHDFDPNVHKFTSNLEFWYKKLSAKKLTESIVQ